jgi:TetR/AcrR family transcriptional repressor of nem operon
MLREKVQEILERKIRYFESAIRDAHSQGLIVASDAKAKAKSLFACYQGTLAQARIHNDLEPIREFKYLARDILGVTPGVAARADRDLSHPIL